MSHSTSWDWHRAEGGGQLVHLAPTRINLKLVQERHPEITFRATREVSVYVEVDQAA
ncbi:MAG: hypothetical protein ACLFSC_10780 [Wenzhouxiangella sp.]